MQSRTGRCDAPDIIWPVIEAALPLIPAVKFGAPSARIAVTATRALCPLMVPENATELRCLKLSVKLYRPVMRSPSWRNGIPFIVIAGSLPSIWAVHEKTLFH